MAVESPCVRNCCLDELNICLGCGRTLDEITGWRASDAYEKARVLELAKQRRKDRTSHLAKVVIEYGA